MNSLLAKINFNIHKNIMLPNYSTLVVLRYTNKEDDVTLHGKELQKSSDKHSINSDQHNEKRIS